MATHPTAQPPPARATPGATAPISADPSQELPARFGSRFAANLLDYFIVSNVAGILAVPILVAWILPRDGMASVGELLASLAVLLAVLIPVTYIYFVEVMFRTGQTLGKRLVGIRVIPLRPGTRLTRGRATVRWLVQYVGGVCVPPFYYLDGLWQLWDDPYRQCLHDKIARTVVISPGLG